MKYNKRYRKLGTQLNIAPSMIDPTPSTVEGTRSIVERFYALKGTEVGGGGRGLGGSITSLSSLPSKKPKRTKWPETELLESGWTKVDDDAWRSPLMSIDFPAAKKPKKGFHER
jgi:hypothetical protein